MLCVVTASLLVPLSFNVFIAFVESLRIYANPFTKVLLYSSQMSDTFDENPQEESSSKKAHLEKLGALCEIEKKIYKTLTSNNFRIQSLK